MLEASPAEASDAPRPPIRVLICDDHAVFRRGLETVLASEPDVQVVGDVDDGDAAVLTAIETTPDVVLMDVRLPTISGIEASRQIADAVPTARILMLTVSDDEDDLYAAIRAGASGYLLKQISIEDVGDAVRNVAAGESPVSPSMAAKLLAEFTALSRRAGAHDVVSLPAPTVTRREIEVLELVAKGMSNRQVAEELYISENTVKNHMRNILEKLHLHSRMEAVMYALREGLFDAS